MTSSGHKPRLFRRDGYWMCRCKLGIIGIGWHVQTAYSNWLRQAGKKID